MSEVRRGFDTVLLRNVAIKLLREVDRTSVARFEREARVLASLQHPNVVSVFDAGTDAEDRYIVMELVEGPTLRDVLDEDERLEPARAAAIAAGVAAALAYAHDRDVVHRDVKPSNVLMASNDHVKLADLGIAKLLNAEALTATMGLLGSANYIAPEQVLGGPVDGCADLYSLGCVLFEMLVGRPPFRGDVTTLAYAHEHTPAPRTRSLDPAVPEPLDDLVASLLEKEPSRRPQGAAEVRAALLRTGRKAQSPATVAIPPLAGPQPTRWLPEDAKLPTIESVTTSEPAERPRPKRPSSPGWIAAVAAAVLTGLLLFVLLPVVFAGDATLDDRAGARSPSSSPPITPSSSPSTTPSSSPSTTPPSSPSASTPSPPEPPSARVAAQHVLDIVNEGIATDEITGKIEGEIPHKIDEAFRELEHHEDLDKALDKITELQAKVSEALDKGEITSPSRAQAINDALDELAAAIEAEAIEAEA